MKRSEVTFHSDGYGEARPAVNVKVQAWGDDFYHAAEKFAAENISDPMEREAFLSAYAGISDDDTWFEIACEDGWENLDSDANWIFCPYGGDMHDEDQCIGSPDRVMSGAKRHVTVSSEGRSGGWAVIDGLPDFDSWDAIMLGKWAKFAKVARSIADYVPYSMADLYYLNRFADEYDQRQPRIRALVGAGMGV